MFGHADDNAGNHADDHGDDHAHDDDDGNDDHSDGENMQVGKNLRAQEGFDKWWFANQCNSRDDKELNAVVFVEPEFRHSQMWLNFILVILMWRRPSCIFWEREGVKGRSE